MRKKIKNNTTKNNQYPWLVRGFNAYKMFTKFEEIFAELKSRGAKKRMVAAWGVDSHTIAAASKAVEMGLAEVTLVGDEAMIAAACKEEGVDKTLFTIVHNPVELSKKVCREPHLQVYGAT